MNKIHKNEQGFSAVEFLLVIIIVILVGFAAWYVYHTDHKTKQVTVTSTSSSPAKTTTVGSNGNTTNPLPTGTIGTKDITGTYSYPGQYFSIKYPSSWTVAATTLPTAPVQPGTLPTVVIVTPPSAYQGETASMVVDQSTSLSNALKYAFVGIGTTVENNQSLTINGYSAMYQQNVISATGGFTDDSYAVMNGNYTVVFTFRVSQLSSPEADVSAFNAVDLLPEFNAIVTSVKF
jgi:uncharacterized protein (UPF0333 family)